MADEPVVWHYGLMAERWGVTIHDAPELPYFLEEIGRFGQPVLDLGCGAGRLLLPLLRAGIDIDGCDISEDMLAFPRQKAAAEGLPTNLYAQPLLPPSAKNRKPTWPYKEKRIENGRPDNRLDLETRFLAEISGADPLVQETEIVTNVTIVKSLVGTTLYQIVNRDDICKSISNKPEPHLVANQLVQLSAMGVFFCATTA